MTGPRLFAPRWLAAGGVAVLAAVLGVALLLTHGGSACAAPPSTTVRKGVATYFFLEGTLGSCSYPAPPADDLYVALGPDQYATAASCGTYIEVTGPRGKVRVKVIDSCPKCPVGHLDLSLTAFQRIARKADGLVPITYRTVPGAAVPSPLSVRVKEGSSRYWLSLLVDNHASQLASVRVAGPSGTFHTAQREEWNYWTLPSGAGRGPFTVKIKDVYGRSATASGIELAVGRTQRTATSLSGAVTAPKPTPSRTPKAAPTPSTGPTPPTRSNASAEPTTAPASTSATGTSTGTAVDLAADAPSSCD